MHRFKRGMLMQLLFFVCLVTVWQIAALVVNIPFILPDPLSVLFSIGDLLCSRIFYTAIARSLLSLFIGFLIGALIGILLAVPSAFSRNFSSFISPLFTILRATPVASFIVIAWVFFSSDKLPAFICALMTAPIIWSNLSKGISSLDRSLYEVTRVFGFSSMKTLRVYLLPSLAPFLSSGLQTALGLAWKASVATEILVRSNETIGFFIWDAKAWNMDTAMLFAWTVIVIIISLLFDLLLSILFRKKRKPNIKKAGGDTNAGNQS